MEQLQQVVVLQAENKGTIVSNRENKGIGIYAKETGSKVIMMEL